MNKRIYRYELELTYAPTARMPANAQVLSVSTERGRLECWALVPLDESEQPREFRVVGTGNPMPDDCGRFIGTVMELGGALVWHVFEAAT